MESVAHALAELASINLHFAQAEITTLGDREAVARALEHVRQAEYCLSIVLAECDDGPREEEAA